MKPHALLTKPTKENTKNNYDKWRTISKSNLSGIITILRLWKIIEITRTLNISKYVKPLFFKYFNSIFLAASFRNWIICPYSSTPQANYTLCEKWSWFYIFNNLYLTCILRCPFSQVLPRFYTNFLKTIAKKFTLHHKFKCSSLNECFCNYYEIILGGDIWRALFFSAIKFNPSLITLRPCDFLRVGVKYFYNF